MLDSNVPDPLFSLEISVHQSVSFPRPLDWRRAVEVQAVPVGKRMRQSCSTWGDSLQILQAWDCAASKAALLMGQPSIRTTAGTNRLPVSVFVHRLNKGQAEVDTRKLDGGLYRSPLVFLHSWYPW